MGEGKEGRNEMNLNGSDVSASERVDHHRGNLRGKINCREEERKRKRKKEEIDDWLIR